MTGENMCEQEAVSVFKQVLDLVGKKTFFVVSPPSKAEKLDNGHSSISVEICATPYLTDLIEKAKAGDIDFLIAERDRLTAEKALWIERRGRW